MPQAVRPARADLRDGVVRPRCHPECVDDVSDRLLELTGGDRFEWVRERSEVHQAAHGCGLHNAGGPVMQLVASIARVSRAKRVLDLGCGIGYSTLWLAEAAGSDATVIGVDDDPVHTAEAEQIAVEAGLSGTVSYRTGRVVDVLPQLDGPFDLIHDDAWFARTPDHLGAVIDLLADGAALTMANWFLLVDALTGVPRNDWEAFAGPDWAAHTIAYAELLAARDDIVVNWVTTPPVGIAVKVG